MVTLNSSLRFYNFEGYSQEEIILKLDSILVKREKQIEDMSLDQLGLNERLNYLYATNQDLEKERDELKSKIFKLQNRIEEETTSKFILFKKYESLDNELAHLKKSMSGSPALKGFTINNPVTSNERSGEIKANNSTSTIKEEVGNQPISNVQTSNSINSNANIQKKQTDRFILASDTIEYEYMSLDYQQFKK